MADKSHIVKGMIFPVVMYGHESWTRKKADCQRIDGCELLRVLQKTLEGLFSCKCEAVTANAMTGSLD